MDRLKLNTKRITLLSTQFLDATRKGLLNLTCQRHSLEIESKGLLNLLLNSPMQQERDSSTSIVHTMVSSRNQKGVLKPLKILYYDYNS